MNTLAARSSIPHELEDAMAYVVVATQTNGDGLPYLLGFGDCWVREYPDAQELRAWAWQRLPRTM